MSDTLKIITGNSTLALKQVTLVLDLFPDMKYELIALPLNDYHHEKNQVISKKSFTIIPDKYDQALLQARADLILRPVADLPYPLDSRLAVIALVNAGNQNGSAVYSFNQAFNHVEHEKDAQWAIVALASRPGLKSHFAKHDIRNQYGKITLVGFGPGNPDLLTLGGDRALAQSDIIFHDDLLDKDYLQKYKAEKVYVGKRKGYHCVEQNEINQLMLDTAKAGKQVVRLKGGDPMIFAHGGEEIEFLERNLMEVQIIPGVSSGIAVASLLRVPLTHRGISSSIAFISGHSENVHLPDADTLVIYMGGSNIRIIARNAIEQGRNPEIPVMMVYNLSMPDQQTFFFTLEELTLTEQKFPTPIIIVIGEVVSFRNKSITIAELLTVAQLI